MKNIRNDIFYLLKPLIPRRFQIYIRRKVIQFQAEKHKAIWPIDEKAGKAPDEWSGWPEGKKFALVLTHDVDTARGQERCLELFEMEKRLGFRSSFNFVPLRYKISDAVRLKLDALGFEVGVHGLYHDGKYYRSKKIFLDRAARINKYLMDWKCTGYRAPCMNHKLDWFHHLNIQYDASTFDTDPFEPKAEGVGTIFPFMVIDKEHERKYVELPYTIPQDFTLFVLMQKKNIDIWKRKLDWVVEHGGMVLMNTHPDYMNLEGGNCRNEEYPLHYYEDFLKHIQLNYAGQYWHVLPRDIASFWLKQHILNKEKHVYVGA